MAEQPRFDEAVRRVFDANLKAYEALGRATTDYIQALTRVWGDAGISLFPGKRPQPSPSPTPTPTPAPAAMVLEADAGQVAQGVFMVENRLGRPVTATVVTSAFVDQAGQQTWPTLKVQPGTVTLEPGARTLVQLSAVVDERLSPGVRYRGNVNVPGLSDTPIPVVLQRRAQPASSPGAKASKPAAPSIGVAKARGSRKRSAAGSARRASKS